MVFGQPVTPPGAPSQFIEHLRHDSGHGIVEHIGGLAGLEKHIGVLGGAADAGGIRGETPRPVGQHIVLPHQGTQIAAV